MKLIIDIPNNVYAKVMEYYEHNEIVEAVYSYIYRGIPLEQIRTEIEQIDELKDYPYDRVAEYVKAEVLQIIAKYTE